ncbi:MAG: hypothetical protein IPM97_06900 [Bdellovibrionaceae bacterium]|nr:hypothetical protein [Pseudobdellovibrionaceae bacterium]
MKKVLCLTIFFLGSVVFADSIKKIESNIVENLVYFRLFKPTYPYGARVDAKGGRYVFEHCGTQNLIEGKHYSLSERKIDEIDLGGIASSSASYYKITPGPECK